MQRRIPPSGISVLVLVLGRRLMSSVRAELSEVKAQGRATGYRETYLQLQLAHFLMIWHHTFFRFARGSEALALGST